jgi:hypothetical protein
MPWAPELRLCLSLAPIAIQHRIKVDKTWTPQTESTSSKRSKGAGNHLSRHNWATRGGSGNGNLRALRRSKNHPTKINAPELDYSSFYVTTGTGTPAVSLLRIWPCCPRFALSSTTRSRFLPCFIFRFVGAPLIRLSADDGCLADTSGMGEYYAHSSPVSTGSLQRASQARKLPHAGRSLHELARPSGHWLRRGSAHNPRK